MSQIYLNGPSVGRAISAEEFAAGAAGRPFAQRANDGPGTCHVPVPPACGCGGSADHCPDDDCGQGQECCCQQVVCCCRPVSASPKPPEVNEGCCCKQSFRAALGLLCDEQISSLLDFGAAAFITNTYVAGAALTCGRHSDRGPCTEAEVEAEGRRRPPCPSCSVGASDNLRTLSGSFRRFAPCTCDLLDIEAKLHTAGRKDCDFTASQVSLCQLDAVVIQGASACAEGELSSDEVTARNFRCLRQRLAQRLSPCGVCNQDQCSCACNGAAERLPGQSFAQGANDGPGCCCAAGLLDALARNNLSRRVSLAAGLLVLRDVTLLGTVGNVLVLSNDADNRLYFVCVNSVQFVG